MRETRADTQRAVAGALALHVLLFALMFAGLWWTRTANPVSAAGPMIEADLIDPNALSAPLRSALDAPAEEPPAPVPDIEPEPVQPEPQEAVPPPQAQPQPQDFIPEPDMREQERVEREAEAARQAAREQEEKRRQEQIDLTERKRVAEQQAREAKQKEIADKLAKVRAEREKAERQAKLAEQRLQQIEDARSRNAAVAAAQSDAAATASPPPGTGGDSNDLAARYAAALQAAILRNWTRPESVPLGQRCRIVIRQIPGGEVIEAKVDPSCPYDELGRRSVEAAVLKAQPLPYAGFEPVFQRTLTLNFMAQDR
ncbi:MAG: cell envelope integrity protein TolA [Lysobacteraceae bacterium]|nr:MAG: cell envelope integrity protein TolA [Xanthomonadaceae bacterium]